MFDARNNKIRIFQVELDIDNLLLSNNNIQIDEYFSVRYVYETLDLSYNNIKSFNMSLFDCTFNLILNNNQITQAPDTCPKKYTRIHKLNLSDNLISILRYRKLLDCMPELEFINIANNQIAETTLKLAKQIFNVNNIKSKVFRNETQVFRCEPSRDSSEETNDSQEVCCKKTSCMSYWVIEEIFMIFWN